MSVDICQIEMSGQFVVCWSSHLDWAGGRGGEAEKAGAGGGWWYCPPLTDYRIFGPVLCSAYTTWPPVWALR